MILLILSQCIFAQFVPDLTYQYLLDQAPKNGSYQSKLESVQAMFIEELFVKQLFDADMSVMIDEEDDMTNLNQSNEFMNMMFAREISKYLAKQDLLNLNKFYYNGAFDQ